MPKIAIVNDQDEIIGAAERADARKQGQIHRLVRVLLHDGKGSILLQKRHPNMVDSPNKWDFSAGGHVDEGEDYDVAAVRETAEELDVHNVVLRPLFKFYAERTAGNEQIRRFSTVYLGQVDPALVHPNPDELGGVEWFTWAQVAAMIRDTPDDFTAGLAEKYDQILGYVDVPKTNASGAGKTGITKAALLLFRDGASGPELMFVRAHGKPHYVFPGGKQEPGETVEQALQRELQEELGASATGVKKLGVVSGQTPDGRDMEMHLYSGWLQGEPHPQAEIEEVAWFSQGAIAAKRDVMTPMTLDHVLPFLQAQGLW